MFDLTVFLSRASAGLRWPRVKRRSVRWAWCLLVTVVGGLVSVPPPAASAGTLPLLSRHGRWLVDPLGRVEILHGVQVDRYMPTQPVEGWVDLSPENVRFIGAQGFNLARVSLAYAGFEPQVGRFDYGYVQRYLRLDRELAAAGVYDLIDMMQGEYSTVVGGGGFPAWMSITDGAMNNHHPFAEGYLDNPAEEAVWDNFWANRPVAGLGLQDHYARGLRRLATDFAHDPALLALEILNEPWPGTSWPACFGSAGCPPGGFDQTALTSFYRRVIPAVRSADPHHMLAYEPNLLFDFGNPTRLGSLGDPNLLFAFHDYCLAEAPGLPPNLAAQSGCAASEQSVLTNAEQRASQGGGALLMDEWGNTTNLAQIRRTTAAADRDMVSWAVWAYEDCCHSSAAIVTDATRSPTAPGNLNRAVLNALVRPYPELIAGTPRSWSYDPTTSAFSLSYSTRSVTGRALAQDADTEIELPALRYPTGYRVRSSGARVASAPDANLLRLLTLPRARNVEIEVTPADHHPRAPGPFAWPTGSVVVPADCPARAQSTIPVRLGRVNPAIGVSVYLDGHRVGTSQIDRSGRIRLPAGLADGTTIRLIASPPHQRTLATVRQLRGCRPTPDGAWDITPEIGG